MKDECQFSQGTANKKRLYGIEAGPSSEAGLLTLPLPEIVVGTKAELEELAGVLGLLVMKECIQNEVRRLVGDRYEHLEDRSYARWGKQRGSVVFAGRKVRIDKPRVRDLKESKERSFKGTEFIAIMIDGIEYQGQTIVVAVGIAMDGKKQVLGLRLGATENTAVVTELLESLVERGLDPLRPVLFVLDGSKALCKAVKKLWGDRAVIQRCQVHKLRNVRAHLPEEHRATILKRIREAYAMEDFDKAKTSLMTTVRYLERLAPGAAGSLEEGLEKTLTMHRLGLRGVLRKTLASTNVIENCQGTTRRITRNVKRWRDGAMIMRWVGCALLEAEKRFNRIKGYRQLSFLKGALQKLVAGNNVDSYAMVA